VIRWDGVSLTYPGTVPVEAVRPTTLEVAEGEMVAITGPSGSGKSSILNVLGLLQQPTGGRYELAGVDVTGADERTRAGLRATTLGFVFQAFHLIDHRDAVANVELGMLYGPVPPAERRPRALDALDRVGLTHRARALPRTMSGGERQRVAVARALAARPQVLLADEPTGNLDRASSRALLDVLVDLHRDGLTVVVVTHDPEVAARAARRIHVVDGTVEAAA
jgi:putative ABC transport system ATP-binding protein